MSRNGVSDATSGTKRAADDKPDLLTMKINIYPTPGYDPSKEQNLHSITQCKEWETYEACEKQIEQLFTGPSANHNYKDKFMQGLLNAVNKCISGRKSEDIVLGIQGPMGMGKSATLNSLFGVGQIALEGDKGGSVTLCSCVYRARKQGQTHAFMAEVSFFNYQERRKILRDYLESYYNLNYGHNQHEETDAEDRPSKAEHDSNLDVQSEVLEALVSLFGSQRECRSKQDAAKFLNTAASPDDPVILTKLNAWCDSLVTKATDDKSVVTLKASTAGELSKSLREFTTYAEDDNGDLAACLTPMVCLITFYLDCPLTRLGMSFQDMPGSTDCNRTRKLSATKYRENRTHCAILSDETRVRDDAEVSKEVNIMSRRGMGRIVVIITRSDVIKPDTMPSGSKKDKETAEQLKKLVTRCNNTLNEIELREAAAASEGDEGLLYDLSKEKLAQEIRIRLVENAETQHRIAMRSAHNKKALEGKLQYITTTAPPIVSISNVQYAKHVQGYRARDTPVLSVEQTNIPALRRIISTFPNEARLNEIEDQQKHNLPTLLKQVRLYTVQSPSERKEELEKHIVYRTSQCSPRLQTLFNSMEEDVTMAVNNVKNFSLKGRDWREHADELCHQWERDFDKKAFAGLLRRDGRRKGNKTKAEVHFSAELIAISGKFVSKQIEALWSSIADFERTMAEEMKTLVDRMIADLQDDPHAASMALDPLYEYIDSKQGQIPSLIKVMFKNLLERINEIDRRMTTDTEDAYLIEAMLPIYAKVRSLKGGPEQTLPKPKDGWPAERRRALREEITKLSGVWAVVQARFEDSLRTAVREEADHLTRNVLEIFQDLHDNFNFFCEEKDTSDPKRHLVQNELKVNLIEAQKILNGPLQQAYEALQRDFRSVNVISG